MQVKLRGYHRWKGDWYLTVLDRAWYRDIFTVAHVETQCRDETVFRHSEGVFSIAAPGESLGQVRESDKEAAFVLGLENTGIHVARRQNSFILTIRVQKRDPVSLFAGQPCRAPASNINPMGIPFGSVVFCGVATKAAARSDRQRQE